jgi:hypothetical protein
MKDSLLIHEFAVDCRNDENKCGFNAKFFVEKKSILVEKTF